MQVLIGIFVIILNSTLAYGMATEICLEPEQIEKIQQKCAVTEDLCELIFNAEDQAEEALESNEHCYNIDEFSAAVKENLKKISEKIKDVDLPEAEDGVVTVEFEDLDYALQELLEEAEFYQELEGILGDTESLGASIDQLAYSGTGLVDLLTGEDLLNKAESKSGMDWTPYLAEIMNQGGGFNANSNGAQQNQLGNGLFDRSASPQLASLQDNFFKNPAFKTPMLNGMDNFDLAQTALNVAPGDDAFSGYCAKGVSNILEAYGISPPGGRGDAYQMMANLQRAVQNPGSGWTRVQISHPSQAPEGSILAYNRSATSGGGGREFGHIEIVATQNGSRQYVSDKARRNWGGTVARNWDGYAYVYKGGTYA